MLNGILTPAFLQAAGRAGKSSENKTILKFNQSNINLYELTCSGSITVKSISNGEYVESVYTDIEGEGVNIPSDANTNIIIIGDLTHIDISDDENAGLIMLNVVHNLALRSLAINGNEELTSLDLSNNPSLIDLQCSNCPGLKLIKYPATNLSISRNIASAITDATSADGTVYTDSDGAYYSTIADAATEKGWTIEQLPA